MKILVIGSEGTIGSKLVPFLKEQKNISVSRCDIARIKASDYTMVDIRNHETLIPAFETKPDVVIHLAGEVSRETSEHWSNIAIMTNCIGTMNVIDCCLTFDSKLVYAGTSEEYGDLFFNMGPVQEDQRPTRQNGVYGLTKWMAEELIEYYHQRYGLKASVMRIFMCYGPGETPNPFRSAVVRFIRRALDNEPLHVHSNTKRSWCYVSDIISGILAVVRYEGDYEIFNLGRDELLSMCDVAEVIIKLTESESEILYDDVPLGIIPVKDASFKKAKNMLDWESKISFDEGIKKTVEWNIERRKKI